ncbi:hypothetical protein SAY86_031666 [Trapa natans]|uniref:Leucine-rich repeat-containing N-terminal plant-type domain-containing protein n=1 Tax=Trapa natans TaxID=22666 RepID=A0AAN7R9X7_TRANT|nr:hypothetical protein SAY86_031666 [Trapa natans]
MVKKALHIILISFLLLLLLFTTLVPSETPVHVHARQLRCHDDERRTLLELKGSLGSDSPCFESWKMEREAGNCCSWTGVVCGGPSSHVVGLDLGLCEKLNDPIPPEIGRLVHLQELSLSESHLEGPIPPSVSNLTELVYLDLSFNYFHGPILPLLSNLTRLEELFLVENQFTGDIPLSMVNLTRLTRLHLSTNQFTGEIPS